MVNGEEIQKLQDEDEVSKVLSILKHSIYLSFVTINIPIYIASYVYIWETSCTRIRDFLCTLPQEQFCTVSYFNSI